MTQEEVVNFNRENLLLDKWFDFCNDMIEDAVVSPKDVAEFIVIAEDFLQMLKEQEDIKRQL
jgi:hypothetical protein